MATSSRRQAIRELFREFNGVGVSRLAEACRSRGIYTGDDVERLAHAAIMKDCRDALREIGVDNSVHGLRFAYPYGDAEGDDSEIMWQQPHLFAKDEMFALVERRFKDIGDDFTHAIRLRNYCVARFGDAPEVPVFNADEVVTP